MVLDQKTKFSLGKKNDFRLNKQLFPRENKKLFLEFGRIVSQKMFFCFFVFPRKTLDSDWKGTVLPLSACSRRTRTSCLAVGF